MSSDEPITATYGHGSIKLTAYPSSGRIRAEASADNSVMDWSDLFEFVDQIRKPRTITTAEELDALGVTAVIRGKWLAEKWADPEGEMWHVAGKGMNWDTEQLIQRGALPATVLYEPTA